MGLSNLSFQVLSHVLYSKSYRDATSPFGPWHIPRRCLFRVIVFEPKPFLSPRSSISLILLSRVLTTLMQRELQRGRRRYGVDIYHYLSIDNQTLPREVSPDIGKEALLLIRI